VALLVVLHTVVDVLLPPSEHAIDERPLVRNGSLDQLAGRKVRELERDAAFTIVAWDSLCGPDCLQQSGALSFIGQWSGPALQQAICSVAFALTPSTQAASVDVITATTTSSEASARLQRTIVSIVCRGARRVNFVGTRGRAAQVAR